MSSAFNHPHTCTRRISSSSSPFLDLPFFCFLFLRRKKKEKKIREGWSPSKPVIQVEHTTFSFPPKKKKVFFFQYFHFHFLITPPWFLLLMTWSRGRCEDFNQKENKKKKKKKIRNAQQLVSAAVTIISRQNKNSEYFLFLFRSRRRNVLSDTVHVCLQRLQTSPRLLPSLVQNKTNTRGTKSRRHWKKVNNKTHKFRLSLSPSLLLSLSRNGMSSGERKKKTAFLSLVYLSTPLPSFPFLSFGRLLHRHVTASFVLCVCAFW